MSRVHKLVLLSISTSTTLVCEGVSSSSSNSAGQVVATNNLPIVNFIRSCTNECIFVFNNT